MSHAKLTISFVVLSIKSYYLAFYKPRESGNKACTWAKTFAIKKNCNVIRGNWFDFVNCQGVIYKRRTHSMNGCMTNVITGIAIKSRVMN